MKLLLRRNVDNLGRIGDVVDVRGGYARNYLIPQGLAAAPTEANVKAIEADKAAYFQQLAEEHAELADRAKLLHGKEVTITALANEEGHLYGSVGPAQIAEALEKEGFTVEAKNILLDESIHTLDKYEAQIRFAEDILAGISVWIVPPHDSEQPQADSDKEQADQSPKGEADSTPPDEDETEQ